jgi:hypothetical protein
VGVPKVFSRVFRPFLINFSLYFRFESQERQNRLSTQPPNEVSSHVPSRRSKEGSKRIAEGDKQVSKGEGKVNVGERRLEAGELELRRGREQLRLAKGARVACAFGAAFFASLSIVLGFCWRRSLARIFMHTAASQGTSP